MLLLMCVVNTEAKAKGRTNEIEGKSLVIKFPWREVTSINKPVRKKLIFSRARMKSENEIYKKYQECYLNNKIPQYSSASGFEIQNVMLAHSSSGLDDKSTALYTHFKRQQHLVRKMTIKEMKPKGRSDILYFDDLVFPLFSNEKQ